MNIKLPNWIKWSKVQGKYIIIKKDKKKFG